MIDGAFAELGYVVLGMTEAEAWRGFAHDILGTMVCDAPDGGLYVKVDEYPFRLLILPAARDGFLAAGWVARNEAAFARARAAIRAAGVEVIEASPADAGLRRVRTLARFVDPGGNHHELCWGRTVDETPFAPVQRDAVFLEGAGIGFGHVVLPSGENFDENIAFWTDVCGLGLSDYTAIKTPTGELRVYFLHTVNGRQHSMAVVERASPVGIFHMMLEARNLDGVGRALDRAVQAGAPLARSIGRHVNDDVVSFYVAAPGGVMIEYGCGGKIIDPASHETCRVPRGSHWGHIWQPGFDPRAG